MKMRRTISTGICRCHQVFLFFSSVRWTLLPIYCCYIFLTIDWYRKFEDHQDLILINAIHDRQDHLQKKIYDTEIIKNQDITHGKKRKRNINYHYVYGLVEVIAPLQDDRHNHRRHRNRKNDHHAFLEENRGDGLDYETLRSDDQNNIDTNSNETSSETKSSSITRYIEDHEIPIYMLYNDALSLDRRGYQDLAILKYWEAIEMKSNFPEALNNLGVLYQKVGQIEKALELFVRAVECADLSNLKADALNNLGHSIFILAGKDQTGIKEAQEVLKLALEEIPDHVDALYNYGKCLEELGNLQEAKKYYEDVLELYPEHVGAHINLGNFYFLNNFFDEALVIMKKAYELKTEREQDANSIRNNLAQIYMMKDDYREALRVTLSKAFQDDRNATIHSTRNLIDGRKYNNGINDKEQTVPPVLRDSLDLLPTETLTTDIPSIAPHELTISHFASVLKGDLSTKVNAMVCMRSLGYWGILEEIEDLILDDILDILTDHLHTEDNLKEILIGENKDENKQDVGGLFKGYTKNKDFHLKLSSIIEGKNVKFGSLTPYESIFMSPLSEYLHSIIAQIYVKKYTGLSRCNLDAWEGAEGEKEKERFRKQNSENWTQKSERELKVMYLSYDFRDHIMGHLTAGLITSHQQKINENIYLTQTDYSNLRIRPKYFGGNIRSYAASYGPPDKSKVRQRIKNGVANFIDIFGVPDIEAACQHIAYEHRPEILVDLMGLTRGSKIGIVALRPAPILISYLGYPSTTPSPLVDYSMIDTAVVIPELTERSLSEKVIYLPRPYQSNDMTYTLPLAIILKKDLELLSKRNIQEGKEENTEDYSYTGEIYNLYIKEYLHDLFDSEKRNNTLVDENLFEICEEGRLCFCNFNTIHKNNQETLQVWSNLLLQVPYGELFLLQPPAPQSDEVIFAIRRELAARGIDVSRVHFLSRVSKNRHIFRMASLCHAFIDTLTYGAHSTATDALWAGIPVFTIDGWGGYNSLSKVSSSTSSLPFSSISSSNIKEIQTKVKSDSDNEFGVGRFASRVASSLLKGVGIVDTIGYSVKDMEILGSYISLNSDLYRNIVEKLNRNLLTTKLYSVEDMRTSTERAYETAWEIYKSLNTSPRHLIIGDVGCHFDNPLPECMSKLSDYKTRLARDSILSLVMSKLEEKHPLMAFHAAQRGINSFPNDSDLKHMRGLALMELGRYEESISSIEEAIRIFKDDKKTKPNAPDIPEFMQLNLVLAYDRIGNVGAKIQLLEEIIMTHHKYPAGNPFAFVSLLVDLQNAYLKLGKYESILSILEQEIIQEVVLEQLNIGFSLLGNELEQQQLLSTELSEEQARYLNAYEQFSTIITQWTQTYMHFGDYNGAISLLTKATYAAPTSSALKLKLAIVLSSTDEGLESSLEVYREAVFLRNEYMFNTTGKHVEKIPRPAGRTTIAIYCDEYGQNWWSEWGPSSLKIQSNDTKPKGLGGSEEAVLFMSREMAAIKNNAGNPKYFVEVYGLPSQEDIGIDEYGVAWYPTSSYNRNEPPDVFIGWRYHISMFLASEREEESFIHQSSFGNIRQGFQRRKTQVKILWLQDVPPSEQYHVKFLKQHVQHIFSLSKFHASLLPQYVGTSSGMSVITPNGIDTKYVYDGPNDPLHFVYLSAPNRGLELVLDNWEEIRTRLKVQIMALKQSEEVPEIVLHVYYGFTKSFLEHSKKTNPLHNQWLAKIKRQLQQQGVQYHGMVDHLTLAKGLSNAGFVLYPSEFPETGCIALMKAMANGCIPITSRYPRSTLPELTGSYDMGPRPLSEFGIKGTAVNDEIEPDLIDTEIKGKADEGWTKLWVDAVIKSSFADHTERLKFSEIVKDDRSPTGESLRIGKVGSFGIIRSTMKTAAKQRISWWNVAKIWDETLKLHIQTEPYVH